MIHAYSLYSVSKQFCLIHTCTCVICVYICICVIVQWCNVSHTANIVVIKHTIAIITRFLYIILDTIMIIQCKLYT